jgi:hypothetical protein
MFIHRGAAVAVCHLEVSVAECIQDSAAACKPLEKEVAGAVQSHEVAAGARKNQQKATISFYSEPREIRNCYS